MTADDRMLVALPTDYILWTEDVMSGIAQLDGVAKREDARTREIWTTGSLSDQSRKAFENLGWKVHEEIRVK